MFDSETFGALASPKRLQILEWLKDPRAHFPPQRDGDLVNDGVCVIFIADKLGVAQPTATAHLRRWRLPGRRGQPLPQQPDLRPEHEPVPHHLHAG